ncbi:MAG: hypothetical protein ABH867_00220 [Patescibacteria group bacterium]|nr:hypothetical protein [Patescibacteria group bacterium]
MGRTILQIPVSKELRVKAEKAALIQGFSSLQEVIRVFMKKLADFSINVSFQEEEEKMLAIFKKGEREFKKGKLKEIRSLSELI